MELQIKSSFFKILIAQEVTLSLRSHISNIASLYSGMRLR